MCTVEFRFSPMDEVKIVAYGLDYQGKIVKCIYGGNMHVYDVQFASDGKLNQEYFFEDQLEPK